MGDINGKDEDGGFSVSQTTTVNGTRPGTFKEFAEPYVGSGLTVSPYSQVTRVLVEGGAAVGVELVRHGAVQRFRARREVVLSAGAIGSPQLLLLSGIGDAGHLKEVGVPVVHHLPGVGDNLHDHLLTPFNMDVTPGLASWPDGSPAAPTTLGIPVVAHVRTGHSRSPGRTDPRPDVELMMTSFSIASDMGLGFKNVFGLEDKAWDYFAPHAGELRACTATVC